MQFLTQAFPSEDSGSCQVDKATGQNYHEKNLLEWSFNPVERHFPPSLLLIFLIISVPFPYKWPVRGLEMWLSCLPRITEAEYCVAQAYHLSTEEVEEDHKFKVIFSCMSDCRPVWTTWDHGSKQNNPNSLSDFAMPLGWSLSCFILKLLDLTLQLPEPLLSGFHLVFLISVISFNFQGLFVCPSDHSSIHLSVRPPPIDSHCVIPEFSLSQLTEVCLPLSLSPQSGIACVPSSTTKVSVFKESL